MSDPAKLSVVPIGIRNMKDIPNGLRRLADDLESGEFSGFGTAIVILGGDSLTPFVYGYGERASPLECCGWLARASAKINSADDPTRHPIHDTPK